MKVLHTITRACSEFSESRPEELKKRSLLKVNGPFSMTSNAESGDSEQALTKGNSLMKANWLLALISLSISSQATAGLLTFRFGPPSLGSGGANPLGIPPGPQDIEVAWLSNSNWETSFSIVPGILFGKRQDIGNFYVSAGGGLIISSNGSGLGPYSAFGWESEGTYRFSFEYKQALGFTSKGMVSPYALRAGVGVVF